MILYYALASAITIYYSMQTDLQLNKTHFPNVARKPQSISTVFQLIRQKKTQFSRQLHDLDGLQTSLPHIYNQRKQSQESQKHSNFETEQKLTSQTQDLKPTESNSQKHKTILPNKIQRSITKKGNMESSFMLSRKDKPIESRNKIDRTKTQFRPIQPRKLTSNTSVINAIQSAKEEQKFYQIQQAKKRFCISVQQIPKNMKLRNEDNLSQTIANLEAFNPFFFRNQKIVNICLLKMGRIILRDSPFQLYKAGEELNHFYIILMGKVKISQGFSKRVCQTGETILEETLFTEKAKKVSLERAKIIGPTYLLELQIEEFKKLKQELIRYGLKHSFQQMEAIIKRNYIIKNWMRNKRAPEGHK